MGGKANFLIMTPKEKAKELYCKYTDTLNIRDLQTTANPFAKKCVLIAVDEIIEVSKDIADEEVLSAIIIYWLKVKEEIKKL